MTLARSVQISKCCGWYACNCGLAPIQTFYPLMRKSLRRNKTGLFIPLSLSGPRCSNLNKLELSCWTSPSQRAFYLLFIPAKADVRYDTNHGIIPNSFAHGNAKKRASAFKQIRPMFLQKCSPESCKEFETSRGTMFLLQHWLKHKYWPRVLDSLPCRKSFHCKMAKCYKSKKREQNGVLQGKGSCGCANASNQ